MSYHLKYLKYKEKYTALKNQIGGVKRHAIRKCILRLSQETATYNLFIENLRRDPLFTLPSMDLRIDSANRLAVLYTLCESFYAKLLELFNENTGELNKYDEFIINSYLNNTFGEPSSLENIGRFKDSIKKYNTLINYKRLLGSFELEPIDSFDGLIGFEDYLDRIDAVDKLDSIEDQIEITRIARMKDPEKRKKEEDTRARIIKERTAGRTEPLFETEHVRVYTPQTELQAKFYGRGTRWCTAADNNNMFTHYKKRGEIYTIISKYTQRVKFQLHLEENELKNSKDEAVTIPVMLEHLNNDQVLLNWLEKILRDYIRKKQNISVESNSLILGLKEPVRIFKSIKDKINVIKPLILEMFTNEIEELHIYPSFDFLMNSPFVTEISYSILKLKLNLENEINLEFLRFFRKLTHLTLGGYFNQNLGDSLNNLTSLRQLTFGERFNQPLGNSLVSLRSLTHLTFDNSYCQELGNSLERLTSLTHLILGGCNQPLEDSLDNLTSLTHLTFGCNFNQQLEDSLANLTSLTHLTFGYNFNQPLEDSLANLTSLTHLTFSYSFNQPLEDSLSNLTSLTHLTFSNEFNQPLEDSLANLTSLTHLTFGYEFNQPLKDSLANLTSLTHLTFGTMFSKPFEDSLDNLINLRELTINSAYTGRLPENVEIIYKSRIYDDEYDENDEYAPYTVPMEQREQINEFAWMDYI